MTETRIINTADFIKVSHDSIEREYNRLPSDELLDKLDPDGTHVLQFHMLHEHAAGEPVAPHMRTIWLVKLTGEERAVEVALDMTLDHFNGLTTIRKNEDGEYEVVIGTHGAGRKA